MRLCTGRTVYRGSRGIALLFHDQRHYKGVRGLRQAPAVLYPRGKIRYQFFRKLNGPPVRSGHVRKISPPPGLRSPDLPASSQSLYWLSYPGTSHNEKIELHISSFYFNGYMFRSFVTIIMLFYEYRTLRYMQCSLCSKGSHNTYNCIKTYTKYKKL